MWKCFHFLSTWIFVAPTLLNPRTRLTHQPSAVRMDFIRVWKLARRVRLCFFFPHIAQISGAQRNFKSYYFHVFLSDLSNLRT
jgi:hypothetical protein